MLIQFDKLSYKNFLGAGNVPIELFLNRSPTTLVGGKNGHGKSSFLDALTFAMFGKSFRGINKNNLINSINGRECLVELTFFKGQDEFKIRRGIKPHVFEIYHNGKSLDQEAAVRDQQRFLEERVLETNFKAFTQVVILGSAAYIPFMQLAGAARRELIENLLDIGLFSNMHRMLKGHQSSWKDQLAKVDREINVITAKLESHQEFLQKLLNRSQDEVGKKTDELLVIRDALTGLKEQRAELIQKIADRQDELAEALSVSALNELIQKNKSRRSTLVARLAEFEGHKSFFHNNDNCSVCQQEINESHKVDIVGSITDQVTAVEAELSLLAQERSEFDEELSVALQTDTELQALSDSVAGIDLRQADRLNRARTLKAEVEAARNSNAGDEAGERATIRALNDQLRDLEVEKAELLTRKEVLDFSARLLKDDGIKAKIIKQYIPIINQQVNKYLGMMNFSVKFTLDENFTETLKSRNRDEFTYMNFSMGERQRIDLALLFAWRDVAKMKNSMNCNLLIFDEVFDSSLDSQGADDLLAILDTLSPETRIFVISHKNLLEDKFRSIITFEKVRDFSRIV